MNNNKCCTRCGGSDANMLFRVEVYPGGQINERPRTWLCAVELCNRCLQDTMRFAKGFPDNTKNYAKVGDYVKIIRSVSPTNRFEVGKTYRVVRLLSEDGWDIPGCVILDCGEPYAKPSEYVVI